MEWPWPVDAWLNVNSPIKDQKRIVPGAQRLLNTISSQVVHCFQQDYLVDNQNQVPGGNHEKKKIYPTISLLHETPKVVSKREQKAIRSRYLNLLNCWCMLYHIYSWTFSPQMSSRSKYESSKEKY